MPRATGPAADTAVPDTTPDTPAITDTPPAPVPDHWRYVGEVMRTYAAIPVTVAPGDVVAHDGPPAADGCWQPATTTEATRRRDNDPEPPTDRPEEA